MIKKIQDVDLDSLSPSLECSAETLNKFKQAVPEVNTACRVLNIQLPATEHFKSFIYFFFYRNPKKNFKPF